MSEGRIRHLIVTLIGAVSVLALGVGIYFVLNSMKKPPVQADVREHALRVNVQEAVFEDVSVSITGYGEVRAKDTYEIAPGVSGEIVEIHPRLEIGEVISAGDVLFRIDPSDYRARLADAEASAAHAQTQVARVKKQFEIDTARLQTLQRSRELARIEFERMKGLYEDKFGAQSERDGAERAYNAASDLADQLNQAIDLYPIRIAEEESTLRSMQARVDLALRNLERTTLRTVAPMRVKDVDLEMFEIVAAGQKVLTLADDSTLEISVPLNSRDAKLWLRFEGAGRAEGTAWFDSVAHVPCKVFWTEDVENHYWTGTLHRVEKFDQQTRTLTVVVRISGSDAASVGPNQLPLVEGMFCKIEIPGKVAKNVLRLPAQAVGFDRDASGYRSVYLAEESEDGTSRRLRTAQVKESHVDGDYVYISSGVSEGDLVVVTRLINPLENTLLDAVATEL